MRHIMCATIVLVLAFIMEPYKYEIMINLNDSYPLFPWMAEPIMSKSPPFMLTLHLISALMMMVQAYIWNFIAINEKYYYYLVTNHLFFTLCILPIIGNFGDFSSGQAMIANGIPLAITWFAIINKNKKLFYYALATPVLFEFVLRIFVYVL
jgi:hypothetical protein